MNGDINMRGIIDFYLPKYKHGRDTFAWGDCTFKIGKSELPLHFDETTWEVQRRRDEHIILRFHSRSLDRGYYAENYEKIGIFPIEISVKFLTAVTGIAEIPLLCRCRDLQEKEVLPPQIINYYGSFDILELSFSDDVSVLRLPDSFLEAYSETVKMEAAMIRQLRNMLK